MKVKDVMSKNPLKVTSNTRIKEITEIFDRVPYWAIFIVDSDKLVGVVTRNDLKARLWDYLLSDPVSQIMSKVVFKIDKDAEVEKAISLLDHYGSNSLAVMDGERLCGIITRYDIKTKYNAAYSSNNFKKTSAYQFKSNKKTNHNTNLVPAVAVILLTAIITVIILRSWVLCPEGERAYDGVCIKTILCQDGTLAPDCSNNKPFQCQGGTLIENASICGCPDGTIPQNEKCVDPYMTSPSNKQFYFTLHGQSGYITTTLYGGLNDYLSTQENWAYYHSSDVTPSQQDVQAIYADQWINQPDQDRLINDLVNSIENTTSDKQDQARIAISIVQNIPYDFAKLNAVSFNQKYPYEVLYQNKGVCGEKSQLLALLLKKLGFGVALLEYDAQKHEAVGINCPSQYSQYNSGNANYCFIESTAPNIVTYNSGTYLGVAGDVTLGSPTNIIHVSDGLSFDASQEYADAQEYENLLNEHLTSSDFSASNDYSKWLSLRKEYGLEEKECTDPATHLCNGECWKECGEYEVGTCTTQGWQCEYDPNNCPPGLHSCNGKCWQGCSSGTWICTTSGGTCQVGQSSYNPPIYNDQNYNCPSGAYYCNGQCWNGCTSQGSWSCTVNGGTCTCNPGVTSCAYIYP